MAVVVILDAWERKRHSTRTDQNSAQFGTSYGERRPRRPDMRIFTAQHRRPFRIILYWKKLVVSLA